MRDRQGHWIGHTSWPNHAPHAQVTAMPDADPVVPPWMDRMSAGSSPPSTAPLISTGPE